MDLIVFENEMMHIFTFKKTATNIHGIDKNDNQIQNRELKYKRISILAGIHVIPFRNFLTFDLNLVKRAIIQRIFSSQINNKLSILDHMTHFS